MKKVAVVLSGCGYLDGAEIHEAVLTLLALDRAGVEYECFAPDIEQRQVVNHVTGEPMPEKRNVLVEAARIARGDIQDIAKANANAFVAAVFPGGYGAALNLSDFGICGVDCQIDTHVLKFARAMRTANKPLAFLCIAPTLIPKIYEEKVTLTIGNDKNVASMLEKMNATHLDCEVQNCVIDKKHKLVTTPAYMLGQNIAEVATGIEKAIHELLALV